MSTDTPERSTRKMLEEYLRKRESLEAEMAGIPEPAQQFKLRQEIGRLQDGISQLRATLNEEERIKDLSSETTFNRIVRIGLTNIRCFQNLELDLSEEDAVSKAPIVFLGDNASGKSTLMQAIAISLCDEGDTTALVRSTPGNFIREACDKGEIYVELTRRSDPNRKYSITTTLYREDSGREVARKATEPKSDEFPWNRIFTCGYGTSRTRSATASYEFYSTVDTILSLFDDAHILQNPEYVLPFLGDQSNQLNKSVQTKLRKILLLDDWEEVLELSDSYKVTFQPGTSTRLEPVGTKLIGPWGRKIFNNLSDGYRSTVQWVLDFITWAIYFYSYRPDLTDVSGILLIDELEQHLHPRWQRYIIQRLQNQFPGTQIFATTHSPLVASGVADCDDGLLVKLEQQADGSVEPLIIPNETIRGKRADQVLASEAFDLITTRGPRHEDEMYRFTELSRKQPRTEAEEQELAGLRNRLHEQYSLAEDPIAQKVERAVSEELKKQANGITADHLDLETKRQLKELFDAENL